MCVAGAARRGVALALPPCGLAIGAKRTAAVRRGAAPGATRAIGGTIGAPFDDGRDGPGGWWILTGPGIEMPSDTTEISPDVAGWRQHEFVEGFLTHADPRVRAYATEVVAVDREQRAAFRRALREDEEARLEVGPPGDVDPRDPIDADDIPF